MKQHPKSAEWIGGHDGFLRLIDQTKLPGQLVFRDCRTPEEVWHSIKELAVRGAPAIGVAAAYGLVLAAQSLGNENVANRLRKRGEYLKSCRPTAVNLAWAFERQLRLVENQSPALDAAGAV